MLIIAKWHRVQSMHIDRHSLTQTRERAGLSISALAALADIGQSHLSLIESGKRGVSPAVLKRLADALDVSPEDLIDAAA